MMTVTSPARAKVEIKKSQFISYLIPYKSFETFMQTLKSEHPKAGHFVWAYRRLNDQNQTEENSSDDGEPKNTSGKPTLKVLQGHNLINAAVITVRYFGGTKLGTGGLVRAYNEAAQEAVQNARLIDTDSLNKTTIYIPYSKTRQTDYQIEKLGLEVVSKEFGSDTVTITLRGRSAKLNKIKTIAD